MVLAPAERSRPRARLEAVEVRRSEAKPAAKPKPDAPADGVAERSAAAAPGRTASDTSAREARARVAADPLAAQLRARADRGLERTADRAVVDRLPAGQDPGAPGGAGPTEGVGRIEAVDDARQKALDVERQLSEARQALGREQLAHEDRNVLRKGWDWLTDGDKEQREKIERLEQRVKDLEAVSAQLPREHVEAARFVVFNERLAAVEKEHGKGAAATLARQTYYNSAAWNGGAGTEPASPGAINAAGFPRGDYHSGIAAEGYDGEMRDPSGKKVDMGHVAAALDWEVNKGRLANQYGNPLDANSVTISGDVASAMANTPVGPDAAARARQAIADEGDGDWHGDIDGQNIAHRLASDPDASLADTVRGYYDGPHERRIDEWATHSKYIQRDGAGVPKRDAGGNYVLDRAQLQKDAHHFADLIGKGILPGRDFAEAEVMDAFEAWLRSAQSSQGTN